MKTNLSTAYKKLTSQERLALIVEAMARNDKTEALRLWDTAPVHTLRGVHPAFSARFRDLETFACSIVVSLQGLIADFHAAYSLNMNRDSFARGWLQAGGKVKALEELQKAQEPDDEEIAEMVFARARDVSTTACAFDEACKQLGFSRDLLVRAFVSPFHAEQLELELPIITYIAQSIDERLRDETSADADKRLLGIDEQLKAETLAAIRSRYHELFEYCKA